MAKRGAEKQLTQDNHEDEDRADDVRAPAAPLRRSLNLADAFPACTRTERRGRVPQGFRICHGRAQVRSPPALLPP